MTNAFYPFNWCFVSFIFLKYVLISSCKSFSIPSSNMLLFDISIFSWKSVCFLRMIWNYSTKTPNRTALTIALTT